jgi:NAD(P)-dependent dehydrogenase (short-subunit alcohol dehydrogenase family)
VTNLAGKTAIVTGGGSGIGEATAKALAAAGVNVVICGRREASLARVAGEIRAAGGSIHTVAADVSHEADVRRVIEATLERFGAVHILVNNAGIGGWGELHSYDVDKWDKVLAVNLRGPFLMSRAVLPGMRDRREGHIINISSESGIEYYEGDSGYGLSKHSLNALGEYTQRENQSYNIRVNTICPGMVVTEMSQDIPGLNQERCLTPDDIAELIMWLVTRRPNVKIGTPILIQTMLNPWENA